MGRSNRRSTTRSSTGRTPRNSTSSATSNNSSNHNFGGGAGNNATNSNSKASSGSGNVSNGGGFGAYNPYDVTPRRFRSNNRNQQHPARKWIEVDIEIAPGLYNTRYVPVSSLSEEQLQKALEKRSRKDKEFQSIFSSGVEINIIDDPPRKQPTKIENDEYTKIEIPAPTDTQQINIEKSEDKTTGETDIVARESTNEQLDDIVMTEADQVQIQIEQQPKVEQSADPLIQESEAEQSDRNELEKEDGSVVQTTSKENLEVKTVKEMNQKQIEDAIEHQPKIEKADDPLQYLNNRRDEKSIVQETTKEEIQEPILKQQTTTEQQFERSVSRRKDEDKDTLCTVVPRVNESEPLLSESSIDVTYNPNVPSKVTIETKDEATNTMVDPPNHDSNIDSTSSNECISGERTKEEDTEPPAKRPKVE